MGDPAAEMPRRLRAVEDYTAQQPGELTLKIVGYSLPSALFSRGIRTALLKLTDAGSSLILL